MDERQVFAVEQAPAPDGPPLLVTSTLPVVLPQSKTVPTARPGRIRPLFRRPEGREPNLAPGLLDLLAKRLGHSPTPLDVLAWTVAIARPGPRGCTVPLTSDPELWARGTELGHRMLWLMRRDGERPKLPGAAARTYGPHSPPTPRTPLRPRRGDPPPRRGPDLPVPPAAWDFQVGGVRVLDQWFTTRTTRPDPGTLESIRPTTWPQPWTSDLLEVITVLSLLAELRPQQTELTIESPITPNELHQAGVLPPPDTSRKPASVLDHHEEGPEGQVALI